MGAVPSNHHSYLEDFQAGFSICTLARDWKNFQLWRCKSDPGTCVSADTRAGLSLDCILFSTACGWLGLRPWALCLGERNVSA